MLAGITTRVGLPVPFLRLTAGLPRGNADDVITVSSAFALAALFLFGPLPAMALWTCATLAADAVGRVHPAKALFNAAQYALCMGAAALALALFDVETPLA